MIGEWIIGAAVGAFAGWTAKKAYDSWKEMKELETDCERLEKEADIRIKRTQAELEQYEEFINRYFSNKNPDDAIEASIELARHVGVPEDRILHSMDELDHYFLD